MVGATFSLAVLALAVSLDGFGVGVMYGLRKIKIPLISILIISCCSGLVIWLSMQLGSVILQVVPELYARMLGAGILIAIGVWSVFQMMQQRRSTLSEGAASTNTGQSNSDAVAVLPEVQLAVEKTVIKLELKRLGLVIQILRTPSMADMDRSGTISAAEAMLLGLALSLDAFGAGIGAVLIGFPPLETSVVIALASGIFITTGLRAGSWLSDISWIGRLTFIPGVILIAMGIMKLM